MKSLLKPFGKILLVLFAIPVLFYLFLVLYNLRDDDLDPDLEKLLAHNPPQMAAAGNGYFAWIGIVGPADQDPHAWGSRWQQEALAADKRPYEANSPDLAINAEKRPAELKSEALPCFQLENCLAAVAAQPAAARAALEAASITLARGDKALAYGAYEEAWRPEMSLTSSWPQHPGLWRHLSATRFALAVAEGQHDQALARLGGEMAFYTRQLLGSRSLLGKMLAVGHLKAGYQLLSQYLQAHPRQAREHGEVLRALLSPLPGEALSLQAPLLSEMRDTTRLLLALDEGLGRRANGALLTVVGSEGLPGFFGDALAGPLLLPKATANAHARYIRTWLAVEGLTDAAYRQAVATAFASRSGPEGETYVLRNPMGHLLNQAAEIDFSAYLFRRDDLVAARAATQFQLDQLLQGSADADAEALGQAVAAAPTLVHPYTGDKPAWDGAKRSLTYAAAKERQGKALVFQF